MDQNQINIFFKRFNKNLSHYQIYKFNKKNFKFKPTFIVALPRGASTFLQQLLISSTNIGYISNMIALFWEKPELGAMLQKKFRKNGFISSFKSQFGNTEGIFEPHEWGFFWRKWLDIKKSDQYFNQKSNVNWKDLKFELISIENILNLPLIFDTAYSNTYFDGINKHLDQPKTIFLFRSPYSVCNSICKARIIKFNNLSTFYAAKPKNFNYIKKIKNPIEQIIAQVWYILEEMLESMSKINKKNYVKLKYEDFFENLNSTIEKLINFTTNDFSLISNVKDFPSFKNRNNIKFFDNRYKKEFDFYYNKYFKGFDYNKI